MFPQMQAKPCAPGRPDPVNVVDRCRAAPKIGIMMRHPTPTAVLLFCGSRATDGEVVDQVEQWLVTLTKIADLRGPVIHLAVDVERPLAFPRRIEQIIPDALQIRRLSSRAAARNQKVATILKMQRGKRQIAFQT